MKKVAFALGSGGTRGFAHLGILEVLEKEGIQICGIIGSSIGAVVGKYVRLSSKDCSQYDPHEEISELRSL
ncbi:MAG: patatin-like phospholipase family protein [Desulfobacteraceae bacterium]|jgi:predicted acylesterase/phospholipase RssA|nr:patatin-like phospholipase family protein [Desulfobacteraceae bacterium]